jgi:hypothetical protein
MDHPLVEKIWREGVDSVNVSMLSAPLKLRLLTEAGDRLMHADRSAEAAHAYALAGNTQKLREVGLWLLEAKRYAAAALFLRRAPRDKEELEDLAERCAGIGEVAIAKELYRDLGNAEMVAFLEKNFPPA